MEEKETCVSSDDAFCCCNICECDLKTTDRFSELEALLAFTGFQQQGQWHSALVARALPSASGRQV